MGRNKIKIWEEREKEKVNSRKLQHKKYLKRRKKNNKYQHQKLKPQKKKNPSQLKK